MEQEPSKSPRKSLTRKQLEESDALELLALLQTVTTDGRVLDEEIAGLKEWLDHNASSALPAVAFLREAVEEVLKDGRVSAQERAWLQEAIETVLPREDRAAAAMRRREAKADDRTAAHEAKAEARERAEKSRPIARFDFMVAGVLHEGRGELLRKHCRAEDHVYLVREPSNKFSRNAILVRLENGQDVGYVPEADAVRLAPLLDQGSLQSADIKKVLAGRKAPTPVIWGELFAADAPVSHAVPMSAAAPPAQSLRAGCLPLALLAVAVGAAGLMR